jgi:hypothetical protein
MKKPWSSFSPPDHWKSNGEPTHFENKDPDGNVIGMDKWQNDYMTRSVVNDETLAKNHILFLGDSFVFGHGVERGKTLSDFFDKLISDDYSCFNLGVPGAGIDTILLRLQQWCNKFGNQTHTVYFGITSLTRLVHWEPEKTDWTWDDSIYDEEMEMWPFLYRSSKIIPKQKFRQRRAKIIHDSYQNLLSNVQCMARFDASIQAVINLSKAYNFNVYFFDTCCDINDKDREIIKEHTEDYNVKWLTSSNGTLGKLSDEEWDKYIIKNDGHWTPHGNKKVASILYNETEEWYKKIKFEEDT